MTYRSPSPERSAEAIGERIAGIASEIDELDKALGAWSVHVDDGASAPPEALAIMARKGQLLAELRALTEVAEEKRKGPGLLRRLFRRVRPK